MATYNKRGYKEPKPKAEKEINEFEEVKAGDSTTAEVFDSLDQKASKIEDWIAKNQKYILGFLGAVALVTIGYLLYNKFVLEPKELEASNEMFQAQQYFEQAVNASKGADSLFNLALKGGEGKLGFIGIVEQYSGTKAANLAYFYAGMAYLNNKKFKEAIEHLENFSSNDMVINAQALGGIGDAFSELNKKEEALNYYKKAIDANENDFTTPRYLLKAAFLAMDMKKNEEALGFFKILDQKYEQTPEGQQAKAYSAMLEK